MTKQINNLTNRKSKKIVKDCSWETIRSLKAVRNLLAVD